jgi:hypothetical protein
LTNKEKAFELCKEGTVLGIKYNTRDWTWEIPQDKLIRFVNQIAAAMAVEEVRQADFWSLAGRIMHYAPLIPCGRFNLDHVIRANGLSKDKEFMVPMVPELKRQLHFWYTLVVATSGLTRIPAAGGKLPP